MNTLDDVAKLLESAPPGGCTVFRRGIEALQRTFAIFPDRRKGRNTQYKLVDAVRSAFAVFFLQAPSWLVGQRLMEGERGVSNAQTLFLIERIPTDNHVRWLLDPVPPSALDPAFAELYAMLRDSGKLDAYRGVDGLRLVALDGVSFHESESIHCPSCTVKHHADGRVSYSHSAVTPVLVAPGVSRAIPLRPEFVVPQDGHDKQDCEIAASKRWLEANLELLGETPTALLGDDLYSHEPFCRKARLHSLHFIFVCLRESHPALYEYVDLLEEPDIQTVVQIRKDKSNRSETWTVRFASNVPLTGGANALRVNWLELRVRDHQGAETYVNAWITDIAPTTENAVDIAASGRARWVVENGNNNVLKTKGYHFEHNFGHGKKHLCTLLAAMNILAFLLHSVLELEDHDYQMVREALGARKTFFEHVKTLTTYLCFATWGTLMHFMMRGLEIGPYARPDDPGRTKKGLRRRRPVKPAKGLPCPDAGHKA